MNNNKKLYRCVCWEDPYIETSLDESEKEKFVEWAERVEADYYVREISNNKMYFACNKVYFTQKRKLRRTKLRKLFDTWDQAIKFQKTYEMHHLDGIIEVEPMALSFEVNQEIIKKYHVSYNPITNRDYDLKEVHRVPIDKVKVEI